MKINKYLSQQGYTTVMALLAMIFLLIVIAGFSPMIIAEVKAAVSDKDRLQAQYAAEAGAKRAVQALDQKIADISQWAWLGTDVNILNGINAKYNVALNPTISSSKALDTAGTYTITSIGKVGSVSRTITVTYQYNSGSGTIWTEPPPDSGFQETKKYTALSNGDVVAYTGNAVTNDPNGQPYSLGTTAGSVSFQWGLPVTTGVTGAFLDLLPASFFSTSNSQLSTFTARTMDSTMNKDIIYGSSWSNLWSNSPITFPTGKSIYVVNGNVKINTDYPLTTGTADRVVIYATGDIVINQRLNGNFVFISEKKIQLNSSVNVNNTGQIEMYAKDDLTLNGSIEGYGVFMTRGGLIVHGKRYVKAFMYGRNYVRIDGGATIQGAVYSYGANPSENNGYSMFVSGGTTITYDASAIP